MRRSTLVLALTSSAIAVALVAIVYSIGSQRSASTVDSKRGGINQAQLTSSIDSKSNESTTVVPRQSNDESKDQERDEFLEPTVATALRKYSADEIALSRKEVREDATRYVHEVYALITKDLDLTSSQQDALLSLVIEAEILRTRTPFSSGKGMDEQERVNRIAAIIGEAKLEQFLARERHRGQYAEVRRVQSMLEQNDVPLTDKQLDVLLKILVVVREKIDPKLPADMSPRSIKSLEYRLDQMDEYERLVLELASSVLSAKQVEHMFDRYQTLSYRRAHDLEVQKQARVDDPKNENRAVYWSPRD